MEDNGKKGGRAMTRHQIETICWKEFVWRRSFKLEQVHEMLAHLATVSSRGAVIWEIRARDGFIRHLLGADPASIHKITEALQVHGDIEFYPVAEQNRKAVNTVRQIKVSHPSLSLRTYPECIAHLRGGGRQNLR